MSSINWSDSAIIAAFISGGFAAVSGIVTLCVYNRKKKIEAKFTESLSDYQANLERTTNELQEKLRVEYGSLYQKRVTAIELIYTHIYALQLLIDSDPNVRYKEHDDPMNWDIDFVKDTLKVTRRLPGIIAKSLIYFSKEDAEKLIKIRTAAVTYNNSSDAFDSNITHENHFDPDNQPLAFWDDNKKILTDLKTEKILDLTLDRFRELIGVSK